VCGYSYDDIAMTVNAGMAEGRERWEGLFFEHLMSPA